MTPDYRIRLCSLDFVTASPPIADIRYRKQGKPDSYTGSPHTG